MPELFWSEKKLEKLEKLVGAALIGAAVLSTGCAKYWDRNAADGGMFTTTKAPYIVIKQSGGVITDVYKLDDAMVQSEVGSDGWLFLDNKGRPVHIGGDMRTIRLDGKRDPLWNCYNEFHMEFENQTYQEKFSNASESCKQFK